MQGSLSKSSAQEYPEHSLCRDSSFDSGARRPWGSTSFCPSSPPHSCTGCIWDTSNRNGEGPSQHSTCCSCRHIRQGRCLRTLRACDVSCLIAWGMMPRQERSPCCNVQFALRGTCIVVVDFPPAVPQQDTLSDGNWGLLFTPERHRGRSCVVTDPAAAVLCGLSGGSSLG